MAYEYVQDLHHQNVLYAEIRYCPFSEVEGGPTGEEYCESVVTGLERGERDFGVKVRSIICFMRENPGESVSSRRCTLNVYRTVMKILSP